MKLQSRLFTIVAILLTFGLCRVVDATAAEAPSPSSMQSSETPQPGATASAVSQAAESLLPLGTPSKFHESFSGIFYNGQKIATESDFEVPPATSGSVTISRSADGATKTFVLTVAPDVLSPAYRELEALEIAYALQPRATSSGAIAIPLFVSQTEHPLVDLILTTTSANGQNIVTGSGERNGTLTFGSYEVPYDYKVRIGVQYSDSGLIMEQGEAQETIGTGTTQQTEMWHWNLSPS